MQKITQKQLVKLSYDLVKGEIVNSGIATKPSRGYKNYHLEKKVSTIFKEVLNRVPFKRKNTPYTKHEEYRTNLLQIMKAGKPLIISIIAFPKKSPNILKTAGYTDFALGEYYVLAKLELFAQILEQYYSPVKVVIVPEASFFHKLVEGYSYFDKKNLDESAVNKFNKDLESAIRFYPHLEISGHLKDYVEKELSKVKKEYKKLWEKNKNAYLALVNKTNGKGLAEEEFKFYRFILRGLKIFIVMTSLENVLGRKLSHNEANALYAYIVTKYAKFLPKEDQSSFYDRVMDILKIPKKYFSEKYFYEGIEKDADKMWAKAAGQIYEYVTISDAKYVCDYRPKEPHLYIAITSGKRLCFDIGVPFPNHAISTLIGNKYIPKVYNEISDNQTQYEEVVYEDRVVYLKYSPKISNIVTDVDGTIFFKGETKVEPAIAKLLASYAKMGNLLIASGRSPSEIKIILKDLKAPYKAILENGARIFDLKKWINKSFIPVSEKLLHQALEVSEKYMGEITLLAYWTKDARTVHFYISNTNEKPLYVEKYKHLNAIFADSWEDFKKKTISDGPCQFMVLPKDLKLKKKYAKLKVTYANRNINVNDWSINKTIALKSFLKEGHTLILCDGENDIPLTKVENKFIAVLRNQETPPELLTMADIVLKNKRELIGFLRATL